MTALGDFFAKRTNDHVPGMQYAADVGHDGLGKVTIPAMAASNADGIIDGQSIASSGSVAAGSFDAAYSDSVMGKFGRNVVVVADGAATSTVTVHGRDYLGQYMTETLTLNGTTAVPGKKAFAVVTSVDYAATASRAIDVGWGNVLGLPYKVVALLNEQVDGAVPGSAGAVVAGLATGTTATATTADPRGTYAPHSSQVPDGSKEHTLTCVFDTNNLHGDAHYAA